MHRPQAASRLAPKPSTTSPSHFETIVVGGGQAGLAMGYYLAQLHQQFVILDASTRVGDTWRKRWDSLHLFTRAALDGLPGLPFPTAPDAYPTKDEIANYLEGYATHFDLPILLNTVVDSLTREENHYRVTAGNQHFEAERVVVATGASQRPLLPSFATQLDPSITQLHTSAYRNPSHLSPGETLVVGAGNSGAEIALELARSWPHTHIWLAGRETGRFPVKFDGRLVWWLYTHVFTVNGPFGRLFKARKQEGAAKTGEQLEEMSRSPKGRPLVRVTSHDLAAAGVERVPRVSGVRHGQPVLADGRLLAVTNVLWSTGYTPDFGWIHLPVFGENGFPLHSRGVVESEPGLCFLGLPFTSSLISGLVDGECRDAKYLAEQIAARAPRRDKA